MGTVEMLDFVAAKTQVALRRIEELRSRVGLSKNPELWQALQDYLKETGSTGCSFIDYFSLYTEIRNRNSQEILECGGGVSTLVIAHALLESERETGMRGRVTSMEESEQWLTMSQRLLPVRYQPYVEFRLSDTIEDKFSLFRGVRYRDIPERDFDFMFVDGPKYQSPLDGTPTFDFDYLHVLRTAKKPVAGLVDKRVSSCFVLQMILGPEKVRYSPVKGLGFIEPCTSEDLGDLDRTLSSANFAASMQTFGETLLRMAPLSGKRT